MFKIIFVIMGAFIGAGFASGREVYVFFSRYGRFGILGIILTGILTSVIIYKVLKIVKTFEINNYKKLLERINWKHERINKYINFIVNSFLLVSFYIMVAGFGSYIKQIFNIPIYISSSIFSLVCFAVFKRNTKGIIKTSEILVPVLIIFLIIFGIKNIPYILNNKSLLELKPTSNNWLLSSILYTSYNSIVLIPVLTNLREYINSKKSIIKISIISGLLIVFLALLIYGLLLKDTYFISQLEMPLLYIAFQYGTVFKYMYSFIIIASIFTTAISTGYSFITNITSDKNNNNKKNNKNNKNDKNNKMIIILCISSIFISNIGFSKLVGVLYPLFGLLGLMQILLLSIEKN